jgi:hypothetical protein
MSLQNETKARRILGHWRGASEAHIRSDLQRASNEASGPKDQRISLLLKAIWNESPPPPCASKTAGKYPAACAGQARVGAAANAKGGNDLTKYSKTAK